MEYNDDFDEEDLGNESAAKRRRQAEKGRDKKGDSKSRGREVEKDQMGKGIEEISQITDKKQDALFDFDDDEDDMLDEMARFVEGQDVGLDKDLSSVMDEDEKVSRRKAARKNQLIEELKGDLRDPHQGMTKRQQRELQEKKR